MKLAIQVTGDLIEAMAAEKRAGERAVTRAMGVAATGLRDDWRGQVTGAGLGNRVARTVRAQVYPERRDSLNAAAYVWTRAPKILDAFERGALIRSQNGFYLAIPTPAAGAKGPGNRRITPGGWEQRTGMKLRFVYRRGGPSLLVADEARINTRGRAVASRARVRRDGIRTGAATVPIFILVPQVRLRKRLDLAGAGDRWAARVPGLIVENWPQ